MKNNLTSNMEDYLEAILEIHLQNDKVRVTDISKRLGVKKSSVHAAIMKLKNAELVHHEPYEDIILTHKGKEKAQTVLSLHNTLVTFLLDILEVPEEIAREDACKIEHVISPASAVKLSRFVEFLTKSPAFNSESWKNDYSQLQKTDNKV